MKGSLNGFLSDIKRSIPDARGGSFNLQNQQTVGLLMDDEDMLMQLAIFDEIEGRRWA